MNETKFTPGPWQTDGLDVRDTRFREPDACYPIATVDNNNAIDDPEANARLISAAPDLYEAARLAAETLEAVGLSGCDQDAKRLRAAIAKAEGKEPR